VSAYPGSNKLSAEHDSIREEQLLQALPLRERRLHPQVRSVSEKELFIESVELLLDGLRPALDL